MSAFFNLISGVLKTIYEGFIGKIGKCIIVNMFISSEMLIGLTWNFFRKLVFRGSALSKRPQELQNKRFWTIFCNFAHVNKSAKQQTIQLEVFYHDLKLTTGFVIFFAIQGVIFSKNAQNWSKTAYLMEYSINVVHKKMLIQL